MHSELPSMMIRKILITKRQHMCLLFIQRHVDEHGAPPTMREIGKHMGIKSTNGVNDHLVALARRGFIESRASVSRGVKVLVRAADTYEQQQRLDRERVNALGKVRKAMMDGIAGCEKFGW